MGLHRRNLAVVVLLGLAGCGPAANHSSRQQTQPSSPIVSVGGTGPFRMTSDRLAALREAPPAPISLPLDGNWHCAGASAMTADGTRLHVAAGSDAAALSRSVDIDAGDYGTLLVRMRLSEGTRCSVQWASDLEPVADGVAPMSATVFPDAQFRTYSIPLNTVEHRQWEGQIKEVVFRPSDVSADVEITSIELACSEPLAPKRISVGSMTREALFGSQPPWVLRVPPRAVFEVYLGMSPQAWEVGRSGRARFVATLDAPGVQGQVLVDRTLDPGSDETQRQWLGVESDLSALAGQEVRITLRVEHLGSAEGGYAYWGNPLVFSREDNGATPVVLISWDTVRADHLSCYGYERETTPHLERWLNEAVLFERPVSDETWTLTAHATMMTGLYPMNHHVSPSNNLAEETVTLAEVLRDAGYLTQGVASARLWMMPWRGVGHGFDGYSVPPDIIRDAFETYALAQDWLGPHPTPNRFLFLHTMDAHSKPPGRPRRWPYHPGRDEFLHFAKITDAPAFERPGQDLEGGEGFLVALNKGWTTIREEERQFCIDGYDDCIRMLDQATAELFEHLRQVGLYDRALIILTADHGEEFGSHGVFGHGNVYEPSDFVPMIIKFPHGRFAGQRWKGLVQLCDLYPTVLDVLGIETDAPVDGHSLLAFLEGRAEPRRFAFMRRLQQRAVRTGTWKLVRNLDGGLSELYDLTADPDEKDSLYDRAPAVLPELEQALDAFFATEKFGWKFAYRSGGKAIDAHLVLTTEDRFESASLDMGDLFRQDSMTISPQEIDVDLGLLNYIEGVAGDTLSVSTQSPTVPVCLRLLGDDPLVVAVGGQSAETAHAYRAMLDPTDPLLSQKPASIPDHAAEPTLYLWYERSPRQGSATPISEDTLDAARALGYLDEIKK